MVDNLSHSPERRESGPAERIEKKQEESRELRETSKEFVEGVSEVVESVEAGEVSERTGEDKKKGPQGRFPGKGVKQVKIDLEPIEFPKIEVMQIQIATEIKQEIALLIQEAKKSNTPYELSGILAKIRGFKDILSELTHLTIEKLRDLWLKFVKKS